MDLCALCVLYQVYKVVYGIFRLRNGSICMSFFYREGSGSD